MSAATLLAFLAPELAAASSADQAAALALAESYRPPCMLSDNMNPALVAKGDEAVALYAAWLLSVRGGGAAGGGVVGPVLMEREGDLMRQYGGARDSSVSVADQGNYKARYDRIARLCAAGSIMTRFPVV